MENLAFGRESSDIKFIILEFFCFISVTFQESANYHYANFFMLKDLINKYFSMLSHFAIK